MSILAAKLLNCGPIDVETLNDYMKDYNVDVDDIVESEEAVNDVNVLMYRVLDLHVDNLKDEIKDYIASNFEDIEGVVDYINLDGIDTYEVDIYTNYTDSGYDCEYDFWYAKDIDDILNDEAYKKDFVRFLINENIVVLNKDKKFKTCDAGVYFEDNEEVLLYILESIMESEEEVICWD